jgi:hypothetical protein
VEPQFDSRAHRQRSPHRAPASTRRCRSSSRANLDAGYGPAPWRAIRNHTSNTETPIARGDAYIYNPTWVYPAGARTANTLPRGMAAVSDTARDAGRIMLYRRRAQRPLHHLRLHRRRRQTQTNCSTWKAVMCCWQPPPEVHHCEKRAARC